MKEKKMATKKLGNLIKKARTDAGLTQEQLARKVAGLDAADISKAERAEKDLTKDQLRAIAKATGVTQKSLLDAAGTSSKTSSKTSAKTSSKTSSKTTSASSGSSMKLSAEEKKLVKLYRGADETAKKTAMATLQASGSNSGDMVGSLITEAMNMLLKK